MSSRFGALREALVDQRRDPVENVDPEILPRIAHRFGRFQRPAVVEDGEPAEQSLLLGRQQAVTPVDRVAQRLLARGEIAGAAGKRQQASFEPREQRGRRQQLDARGGQLDRHRQAVEPRADFDDRGRVFLGQHEVGSCRDRALHEQRDRRALCELVDMREIAPLGQGQRRDGILALGVHVEHRTARDEHLQPRRTLEQLGDERRGVGDVLEVVDDEQQRRTRQAQVPLQRVDRRFAALRSDVQRLSDRRRHEPEVGNRRQRDVAHGAAERLAQLQGDLHAQAALAHAARPRQRDPSHVIARHEALDRRDVAIAADQRRAEAGQVRAGKRAAVRADVGEMVVHGDEIAMQIARRRVAVVRVLRQAALDRPLQRRRDVGGDPIERFGILRQHRRTGFEHRAARERALAARELVQNRAQ